MKKERRKKKEERRKKKEERRRKERQRKRVFTIHKHLDYIYISISTGNVERCPSIPILRINLIRHHISL
jgi:hypothetical protein